MTNFVRQSIILLFLFALIACGSQTKIDPMLSTASSNPSASASLSKSVSLKTSGGVVMADVIMKVTDSVQAQHEIEMRGGYTGSVISDIMTATLPLHEMESLSNVDEIVYIEASRRLTTKLDFAHTLTGVADAHAGTGVVAQDGSGVVVGIVDSGIDCDHADFLDANGDTRLLSYWDQSKGSGGVAEIAGSSGTEYVGGALASGGSCTSSRDSDSATPAHGTHIAGIAAGNDSTYKGVAPDSNIVAVLQTSTDADSGGTFSSSVLDAINYIFKKANASRKPAVVNISLGTSIGAHDNTSLFEQGINNLLIESGSTEKVGRAITCAAGNENFHSSFTDAAEYGGIHGAIDVADATGEAFEFEVRSGQAATVFTTYGGAILDVWLTAASTCTVEMDMYLKSPRGAALIDMSAVSAGGSSTVSGNNVTIALDFTDNVNANNGKQHAQITITRTASTDVSTFSFDLIFKGTCTGDVWLYPDLISLVSFTNDRANAASTDGAIWQNGDSNRTMTIPGTSSGCITATSFMARDTYGSLSGTQDQTAVFNGSATDVSTFASLGPTADARTKPDIAAPGEPIISTLASTATASNANKGDATHQKLQGTSMASPYVAGVIALMLEKSGCLKPAEIKSAIQNNAAEDGFTGSSLPDDTWGYGKIDAVATLNAITATTCIPQNASETTSTASVTVSKGGGACMLIKSKIIDWQIFAVFFIILIALMSWRYSERK